MRTGFIVQNFLRCSKCKNQSLISNVFRPFVASNFTQVSRFSTSPVLTPSTPTMFTYPEVKQDASVKEILHGVEVTDCYRWLEDPDSEETKKFIEAQNAVTMPYINSCPYKEKIHQRLEEIWDYPKYGCPFKEGEKYFYYMNTGLQNQSVLYVQDSLDSPAKVFLDPNKLSEDGTTALSATAFSEDGKWFAYGLSDSGSDWTRIKIRNVDTGVDELDTLERCKFTSISWTHDHKGFFYSRYPEQEKSDGTETIINEFHRLYYHRVGTKQSEDILVVQFPDHPKWLSSGSVSHCGRYLFVSVSESCKNNRLYYCEIDTEKQPIKGELKLTAIVDTFEADYEYVHNIGNIVLVKTDDKAPNSRLVKIDLSKPSKEFWVDLLPEHKKDVLSSVSCINKDYLVVIYMRDVVDIVEIRSIEDGSLLKKLDVPIGTIASLRGKWKHTEFFFYLTSFITPGTIYRCDMKKDYEVKVFREITVKNFNSSDFVVEQNFYESKDKTKVPIFLVRPKDIALDGSNPCLLYGYGGFNISIQPYFRLTALLLMKNLRGIFAVANIRGGGEYGERWHDGGKLLKKQNCFDDFQAAGEFLIKKGYTNNKKLIIEGGSNGGLLVAACANQRPDLFGCVIAHVGVMDMLRFHKFTIGHAWVSDFGNPDEKEHFENVLKFSPLHNVPKHAETYPATLLLTADHDDRVVPLHSLKLIAQLQHTLGKKLPDVPLMIRVDCKAGHGAGKPTAKLIEEATDMYCFIIKSLGLKYFE